MAGWWSTATGAYDEGILGMLEVGLDPAMLPEVLPPDGIAGTVTDAAATFLGIPSGIPVGPGSGDNAGAALGLGLEPGTPVVSLGTSGVAFAVSVSRSVGDQLALTSSRAPLLSSEGGSWGSSPSSSPCGSPSLDLSK